MRRLKYWVNNAKQEIISLYSDHLAVNLNTKQSILKPLWIVEHVNIKALSLRCYYYVSLEKALRFINMLTSHKQAIFEGFFKRYDSTLTFIGVIISILAYFGITNRI